MISGGIEANQMAEIRFILETKFLDDPLFKKSLQQKIQIHLLKSSECLLSCSRSRLQLAIYH